MALQAGGIWFGDREPTTTDGLQAGQVWLDTSGVPVIKVAVAISPTVWKIASAGVAAKTVSANYTLTTQDFMVIASAPLTFQLPSAVGLNGTTFRLKNNSSGAVTVLPASNATINGEVNQPLLIGSVLDIVSDGSNW